MTTRTSHASGIVDLADFAQLPPTGRTYLKNAERTVSVPIYARKMRVRIEERTQRLKDFSKTTSLNRIEPGSEEIGVITSGVLYQYLKEVFPEASVLKLGFTNPLPTALIKRFSDSVKRLYVIEELDPFLDEQIRAMGVTVQDYGIKLNIGELNPFRLRQLRAEIYGEQAPSLATKGVAEGLPARPPVLCAGCGHRSIFYALQRLKVTVTGDIGCYSLGAFKPLDAMDSIICMGASIGNAFGFEKAGHDGKIVAIIGDSTFFHSGITGLLNIVYNRGISTVIVLDNRTTAMTGHQDHPGTGRTLMGAETKEISVEQVARGVGVERVRVIDCYDLAEVEIVLKEEMDSPEPSVIVAKRPCITGERMAVDRQFEIDVDACSGCRLCLRLGCPALELGEADPDKPKLRRVKINSVLCAGCGMCFQVCRNDAVVEAKPKRGTR
jgi:indolepyruvate ferredoxin oxidoreductase, alpha subunit